MSKLIAKQKLSEVLDLVQPGCKLTVAFIEENAQALMYLQGMFHDGFIAPQEPIDQANLYAVGLTGDWESVERTFVFDVVRWDDELRGWFGQRLREIIEDIEVE